MNWDLIGHQWAADILRGHIKNNTIRNAYLITGPEGVGRRTLAVRFMQALNCPHPTAPGVPCRECHTCQQIEAMRHPDLWVLQSLEESQVLRVDQVREVLPGLSLTAYEGPYKMALFLRFEEAHPSAANALLKTLEEPPEQVVIVLTAENADTLLETIVSRCEEIHLRPAPLPEIQAWLGQRWDIPSEQAALLAHISGGRPGRAAALHLDPSLLEARKQILDEHERLLSANRVERFQYARKFKKDQEGLKRMIQIWTSFWRDVMLLAGGSEAPLINIDRETQIHNLLEHVDVKRAQGFVQKLEKADALIKANANLQLTAEVLMLDLPSL